MEKSIEMRFSYVADTVVGITEKTAETIESFASVEGMILRLCINKSLRTAMLHEGVSICKYLRGRSRKVDSIVEAVNLAHNRRLRFKKCPHCQPKALLKVESTV